MSLKETNESLRQRILQHRAAMLPEDRAKADQSIQKIVLKNWNPDWKSVLIYVHQPSEVATIPLILSLLKRNIEVCVPAFDVLSNRYFPSILTDFETEMEIGRFDILEPKKSAQRPKPFETLHAALIPGIAFDPLGNRLGYGYGYFDEICRKLNATKIGLAYHFQMVDRLEPHLRDVPMDDIITEKGIEKCLK